MNRVRINAIDDLGFMIENTWQVAICKACCFVVDKALIISRLHRQHALQIPNEDAVLSVLSRYNLRPHLPVIWDATIEEQLDESDGVGPGSSLFRPPGFRPGSIGLRGIPVHDGFKCQICEHTRHVCVVTKDGMRTHYRRHHKGQTVEFYSVKVQVFYDRSKAASQLRYVLVNDTSGENPVPFTAFGIPENVHSVPGYNSVIIEKKGYESVRV